VTKKWFRKLSTAFGLEVRLRSTAIRNRNELRDLMAENRRLQSRTTSTEPILSATELEELALSLIPGAEKKDISSMEWLARGKNNEGLLFIETRSGKSFVLKSVHDPLVSKWCSTRDTYHMEPVIVEATRPDLPGAAESVARDGYFYFLAEKHDRVERQELVNGHDSSAKLAVAVEKLELYLQELEKKHGNFFLIPFDPFPGVRQMCIRSHVAVPEILNTIDSFLSKQKRVPTHWDLHAGNILRNNKTGNYVIIDRANIRPAVAGTTFFKLIASESSKTRAFGDKCLSEYISITGHNAEAARVAAYSWAQLFLFYRKTYQGEPIEKCLKELARALKEITP